MVVLAVLEVLTVVCWGAGVAEGSGVESPMSSWRELEVDELVVGPGAEGVTTDSKGFSGNTGTNQLRRHVGIVGHLEM